MSRCLALFVFLLIASSVTCVSKHPPTAPVASGPALPTDPLPDLIARVRQSVVRMVVIIEDPDSVTIPADLRMVCPWRRGVCVVGTGFFVNRGGSVVTAYHVASDMSELQIRLTASSIRSGGGIGIGEPNQENERATAIGNFSYFQPP